MHILLVAATQFELEGIDVQLPSSRPFSMTRLKVTKLVTGMGSAATSFALGKAIVSEKIDLVINVGLAGTYDKTKFPLGSVTTVGYDCFADLGAEDQDGTLITAQQLDLSPLPNNLINSEGYFSNPHYSDSTFLPVSKSITVNTASGSIQTIEQRKKRWQPDIETLEGAAVAYCCLMSGIQYLQLRAISNLVEPRNRDAWKIQAALTALRKTTNEILDSYTQMHSRNS